MQGSGTVLPERRGGGAPSHSSLIPGAPALPTLGGGHEGREAGSLLGRGVPQGMPVMQPAPAMPASQPLHQPMPRGSRPLRRPKRASNIFMFSLAVIFLLGTLAAAGWMFREPLMEIVHKYMPAGNETPVEAPVPSPKSVVSAPAPGTESEPVNAPAPTVVAEPPPEKPAIAGFDPDEPAPPKAVPLTDDERTALTAGPGMSNSQPPAPAVPDATPGSGLQEVPQPAPDTKSGVARADIEIEVPEEAKPAAEALMKFLTARTLEDRLRHSLAPDFMRPLMERYYKGAPEGPVKVDAVGLVRFDPKPQIGGGAHAVFGLESREWEFPIPVMLEEGKDGFRVDWLSFVEFKDRLLERFFENYQEGPARFHVGITRTHYFDDKVPNSGSKDAFLVSPAPPNPWKTTVFLDKDSPLARDLRERIPWGAQVWAVVELEWVKLGATQWVQLAAVPQLNWYSVPAANGQAGGGPSSQNQLPNEIQRAAPVGR